VFPFVVPATTLFAALVIRATATIGATTDVTVTLRIQQN
jgi:hypothetical protein